MRGNDLRDLLRGLLGKNLWELQYDLNALLAHQAELRDRIKVWAKKHCPYYKTRPFDPVDRQALEQAGDDWVVSRVSGVPRRTSGTTGKPLEYRLWMPREIQIAKNNEILREFGVRKPPRILRIKPALKLQPPTPYEVSIHKPKVNDVLMSAGAEGAETHVISHAAQTMDLDLTRFVGHYVERHGEFDVFITSWSFMSLFLQRMYVRRLARLCWTTCESTIAAEVELALDRGCFEQVCDHMRCWDGGATFFTCKYGTYHSMDWLVDMWEDNGELATTDFFNLATPFINYRNGDAVRFQKTWAKCQCGRYYRPMQFYGKRDCFTVLNRRNERLTSIAINDVIEHFPVFVQAVCGPTHIAIISAETLSDEHKARLTRDLPVQLFFHDKMGFYRTGTHQKLRRVVYVHTD